MVEPQRQLPSFLLREIARRNPSHAFPRGTPTAALRAAYETEPDTIVRQAVELRQQDRVIRILTLALAISVAANIAFCLMFGQGWL